MGAVNSEKPRKAKKSHTHKSQDTHIEKPKTQKPRHPHRKKAKTPTSKSQDTHIVKVEGEKPRGRKAKTPVEKSQDTHFERKSRKAKTHIDKSRDKSRDTHIVVDFLQGFDQNRTTHPPSFGLSFHTCLKPAIAKFALTTRLITIASRDASVEPFCVALTRPQVIASNTAANGSLIAYNYSVQHLQSICMPMPS